MLESMENMDNLDLTPPISPHHSSLSSRSSRKPILPTAASSSYFPPEFEETPLHDYHSASVSGDASSVLKTIWSDKDSQQQSVYLGLRIAYTLVTLVVSSFSNSVGLVCLGFHALFECIGMGVELWANAASKYSNLEASLGLSYGFYRLEVLSGFANAVFLIFVSIFTLEHSVESFFEPPAVYSGPVMTIAVVGCILNLVGLLITQSTRDDSKKQLRGEVLWVRLVADNLASFGVIFSAYFAQLGYNAVDPLVAALISVVVIYTSIPLAKETSQVLLLATPKHIKLDLYKCLGEVLSVDGVHECSQEHFWTQANGFIVGSLHVTISREADEQETLRKVSDIFRPYVNKMTIQIHQPDWAVRSSKIRE